MIKLVEGTTNVTEAQFGVPTLAQQLRAVADKLEAGGYGDPDVAAVVFGSTDPTQGTQSALLSLRYVHAYFLAGMLQNAQIAALDQQAWETQGDEIFPE